MSRDEFKMNRRGFLLCLGAFAASAALPAGLASAKVARAPSWAKHVMRYECAPLAAGQYVFTAHSPKGLLVTGVTALGGETVAEVFCEPGDVYEHAVLAKQDLGVNANEYGVVSWETPRTNLLFNSVGPRK